MFSDIPTLFHENVLVPFKEYMDAKAARQGGRNRDLRLGLVAAASAYHFREHLRPPHAIEYKVVRDQCPEYGLLRDVVNASKHGTLTKGQPSLTDASDICQVTVITEYADEAGAYNGVEKIIQLSLKDGTHQNLHDVLRTVVNFWISHLTSHNLISPRSQFIDRPRVAPSREEAGCGPDGSAPFDLEVIQGLPLSMTLQLRKYQTSGTVALVNNRTGEKHERHLTFSVAESTKLSRCGSDAERQLAMNNFPVVQSALDEIRKELGVSTGTGAPDGSEC